MSELSKRFLTCCVMKSLKMNCIRTFWCFTLMTPIRILTNGYSYNFGFDRESTTFPTNLKGPPWRILFLGTDDFSLKHLERLCSKYNTGTLISKLAVCTSKNSLVARLARFENLTIYSWPLKMEQVENEFDLGVVVSFGHLVPKKLIDAMPLGILNVHGSLLPRWRGAAPIHYAIMAGDNETGVTVMRINPFKFDTGDIVRQHKCIINATETTPELRTRLAEYGADLLMSCIRDLPKCLQRARSQREELATYAPRITSATAVINWDKMTVHDIFNLQRAISHMYPLQTRFREIAIRLYGVKIVKERPVYKSDSVTVTSHDEYDEPPTTTTTTQSTRNRVREAFQDSATEEPSPFPQRIVHKFVDGATEKPPPPSIPGKIIFNKGMDIIFVACLNHRVISVSQVCMAGKKALSAVDFYNGYLSCLHKKDWRFY